VSAWSAVQGRKAAWFVEQIKTITGLSAAAVPDPAGMPFPRVCLDIKPAGAEWSAQGVAAALQAGTPSIWVMEHAASLGQLWLELVPLTDAEMQGIIQRLHALAAQFSEGR
jgi:L-seryl-tRNA(Ser) seleniumtransferase